MSHTPGPWKYEEPGWDGLPYLTGANGELVAELVLEPQNPRDICLLEAAPELWEELREMLYYARCMYEQHGGDAEQRGLAPKIKVDIDRVEALLKRIDEEDENA